MVILLGLCFDKRVNREWSNDYMNNFFQGFGYSNFRYEVLGIYILFQSLELYSSKKRLPSETLTKSFILAATVFKFYFLEGSM